MEDPGFGCKTNIVLKIDKNIISRPACDVTCISKIAQDGGWLIYDDLNQIVLRSKQHLSKLYNSCPGNPKILSNKTLF